MPYTPRVIEFLSSLSYQNHINVLAVAMLTATLGPQLTTIEMNHELRVF